MTRNPLVIVVGLTGVGKTTVTERAIQSIETPVEYLSYGSLLLEEGQRQGLVDDRDEITDLAPDAYDALQTYTAERIHSLATEGDGETVYLIDTHATLKTPYGYRPGFSADDVETIDPDQFVFVRASPTEVQERRAGDSSRSRETVSVDSLREQQEVAMEMTTTFAAVSRSPLLFIDNPDGGVENAASEMVPVLERTD